METIQVIKVNEADISLVYQLTRPIQSKLKIWFSLKNYVVIQLEQLYLNQPEDKLLFHGTTLRYPFSHVFMAGFT